MRLRRLGQAGAYAKRISAGLITLGLSVLMMGASSGFRDWHWNLPAWVPEPVVPLDNPMSVAKVELGRHLFYDTRLSADGSQSCASCHHQDKAFTDGQALSVGVTGETGARSAMGLANVAYLPTLTWVKARANKRR